MSFNVICDLDGTLCDTTHRQHFVQSKPKNWKAFFAGAPHDSVNMPVFETILALYRNRHKIIFVSGRPEECRADTETWLRKNCHRIEYHGPFMRAEGDYRPDDIVKEEIFRKVQEKHGYGDYVAFDDRDRVVKMWRSLGVPCFQVAHGDF